jgi:Mg2+ and Co2+ transporter CorA
MKKKTAMQRRMLRIERRLMEISLSLDSLNESIEEVQTPANVEELANNLDALKAHILWTR